MADPKLKQALKNGEFILAPGVFDLISALIADTVDFKALYVTGYGTVASYLGLPDAGIATYRDMVERIGQIVKRVTRPVIADADTGYGGLLNVRHTVRGYEDAGVSAIQIEDQEFPKKCGHTPNRRVTPLDDMLRKIEVAVDSRRSDDFLIIARTDARTGLGLDEAIRRGQAFAKAGADVVFVESHAAAWRRHAEGDGFLDRHSSRHRLPLGRRRAAQGLCRPSRAWRDERRHRPVFLRGVQQAVGLPGRLGLRAEIRADAVNGRGWHGTNALRQALGKSRHTRL